MAVLHLVSSRGGLRACQQRAGAQDVVVLLGDGVYMAADSEDAWVLEDHAEARGVPRDGRGISIEKLVELTEAHAPVVTWR